jgi:hypothetical protein
VRPRASGARRRAGVTRAGPPGSAEGDGNSPPSPAVADVENDQQPVEDSSNSRFDGEFVADWSICDWGVDTVSYAFRPSDPSAIAAFMGQPHRRFTSRERGSSYWATQLVGGVMLGAFPSHGLLVAEGRLAPMLSGDPDDAQLAPPSALALGAQRAREAFAKCGVSLDCEAVVRRLDLAADIHFDSREHGLLFLQSMDGIHLPRHTQRRDTARQTGRVTSLAWLAGSHIALRLYDAGLHHGTDAAGARVRLERQVRYAKRDQRTPGQFTRDLSEAYLGPLSKLIAASPKIVAMSPRAAEHALVKRHTDGELSLAVTERLLGTIRVCELGIDESVWRGPDTRARRLRDMRKAGLFIRPASSDEPAFTDVRPLLSALGEAWRAR